jgi:hypothetical protein
LIRPILREDIERTGAFIDSLSPPSKHFLFPGGVARIDSAANTRMRALARNLGFREQTDPNDPTQVICYLNLVTPQAALQSEEARTRQA